MSDDAMQADSIKSNAQHTITFDCDSAILPRRASPNAAGFDLFAAEDKTVPPSWMTGLPTLIDTGAKWCPPTPTGEHKIVHMLVTGRSGLCAKHGMVVDQGIVDADYRGNIKVMMRNRNWLPYTVRVGERIAQGVVHESTKFESKQGAVDVKETQRGAYGFGSTGST